MQTIIVDLKITASQYLTQYRVPNAVVITHARCGRRVRFPANILQPYVTHSGIDGSFKISFNEHGKLTEMEKL